MTRVFFWPKIPSKFSAVWTASFSYYFTDKDAELYHQNPEKYSETPVQQRLRYYVNHWSEQRFFVHRDSVVWTRENGWPESLIGELAYPIRIWVKHYAYRAPEQIEQRLRSRRPAIESGTSFSHEALENWSSAVASVRQTRDGFAKSSPDLLGVHWEERVVPASSLDLDRFDRRYVVNESLMPQIPQDKSKYYEIVKQLLLRSVRKQIKELVSLPKRFVGK